MSKSQQEDLIIEWCICGPEKQKALFEEFKASGGNTSSIEDFHNFLKDRLGLDSYWEKIFLT